MAPIDSNPNAVFWLARYAHNHLAPHFAKAKSIEPSLMFSIEITFADEDTTHGGNHVSVVSHWKRDGMFQMSTWLFTTADVDRFVAKVAEDAAKLESMVTA